MRQASSELLKLMRYYVSDADFLSDEEEPHSEDNSLDDMASWLADFEPNVLAFCLECHPEQRHITLDEVKALIAEVGGAMPVKLWLGPK